MEYRQWRRYYSMILRDFGYSEEDDRLSASLLSELLRLKQPTGIGVLKKVLNDKDVIIFGGFFPGAKKFLKGWEGTGTVIAADGVTSLLLNIRIVPDVIVTDLDGNVADQVKANKQGAIVVVHAHGDNMAEIKKYVPKFTGSVIGTTQSRPVGGTYNFGGFTDGDRAVFLAHRFKARSIRLAGFDYEKPYGKKRAAEKITKLRKLGWAKRLVSALEKKGAVILNNG